LLLLGVGGPVRAQGRPRPPQATALARLQAARSRWPADSLGRLLVYVGLAAEFRTLQRPDSAAHYLARAWRGPGGWLGPGKGSSNQPW